MKRISGRRKRTHELAVRATISMPPLLWEWGAEGMKHRACSGLSDYLQMLIRADKKHRQQIGASLG
jgi:hypothetical protein